MKPTSMSLATHVSSFKEGDDIDSVAKPALTIALDNADYGWAGDKSTLGNIAAKGIANERSRGRIT